ncbi:MAG TPA: cation:proton antiporter, partial [Bacteroidota bacterium]
MQQLPFLKDFVIILAAAVLIIFLSHRVRLPSIVGFLITGMLIGPFGLNFVSQREQIEVFADIGVVMLLFFIGLEFSLSQLRAIRREFFFGGGLQVFGTIALVVLLLSFTDFSMSEKTFFGFLVALSSTAIVLKILADRFEIEAPHGKLSVGMLLFQDFFIVPMIAVTPLLAGGEGVLFRDVATRFLVSIAAVAGVFVVARFIMPKVLYEIARTRVREAFLLGSLLVCLLMAGVAASLGFSYALGAFIAGLIISESEYSHEVVAEIVSFRDLFTSMFFISIGMLLNLDFVYHNLPGVLGLSISIFFAKAAIVFAVVIGLKFPYRTAVLAAFGLAQIGEFSFVLAKVGLSAGLLNESLYQHFLGASILTMIATPALIHLAPALAKQTAGMLPFRADLTFAERDRTQKLKDHVIVAGYGVNGQNVARVLRETGLPYIIVEANGEMVRRLKTEGYPVIFGDITRKDIFALCNIEGANTVVLTISDPRATRTAVRIARSMNAQIHIIVRTRLVAEVDEL